MMNRMRWTFLLLASLAGLARAAGDGWVDLFDGQTLNGWTQRPHTAAFRVADGAIVAAAAPRDSQFLCTEQAFSTFELELEVRLPAGGKAGVQLRSLARLGRSADRVYGPQVELEPSGAAGGKAGYLRGEDIGRAWVTPAIAAIPHKLIKDGEWNQVRVVAMGPRVQTWINGEPVADQSDAELFMAHPSGFIALQVEAAGSKESGQPPPEVAWRKIRVREIVLANGVPAS